MSQQITNIIGGLYEPYTFESITISSSALGLTAGKYNPSDPNQPLKEAQCVVITSETDSIRYTFDGTTPTASLGHLMTSGGVLVLVGISAIRNFRGIRTNTDATLMVTYQR